MCIVHLDYVVPVRITSHSWAYLLSFRCNYSIHADGKYHSYTYVSIARIIIHIGTRTGNYQCCDYKFNLLLRIECSHYVTGADFPFFRNLDQNNYISCFINKTDYIDRIINEVVRYAVDYTHKKDKASAFDGNTDYCVYHAVSAYFGTCAVYTVVFLLN